MGCRCLPETRNEITRLALPCGFLCKAVCFLSVVLHSGAQDRWGVADHPC